MKDFIAQLRVATFSTPSEYISSLIRIDQESVSGGRLTRLSAVVFVWGRDLPQLARNSGFCR
jgi:hypothetical protein